jgi:hypothetical protein
MRTAPLTAATVALAATKAATAIIKVIFAIFSKA